MLRTLPFIGGKVSSVRSQIGQAGMNPKASGRGCIHLTLPDGQQAIEERFVQLTDEAATGGMISPVTVCSGFEPSEECWYVVFEWGGTE